jgi:hypothetical protein
VIAFDGEHSSVFSEWRDPFATVAVTTPRGA